jgi:Rhodopirellula transposase DDE domain
MEKMAEISERFKLLSGELGERERRLVAGAEAIAIGRGEISLVSRAIGMTRRAVAAGMDELKHSYAKDTKGAKTKRARKAGGGRKKIIAVDPILKADLENLVEPLTRGDPNSPLRWTCKSVRVLADELKTMGHIISYSTVSRILGEMKYSLQSNQKTLEGSSHPDRNAQFEFINEKAKIQLAASNPVISVDTKKKELVGNFKNAGKELCPAGQPEKVNVHDFVQEQGHAIPYGVLDIASNAGWVSVGTDHDTATFAVETIRRWWYSMGKKIYPSAEHLFITADGGGSNGSRVKLWKLELQNFADELGFPISVSHLPPGTSKWNKIEHRLFSFITQNWRGKPLISHEVIIQLIRATKTRTGLKVGCDLDTNKYPTGRKFSKKNISQLNISYNDFHGEWNYAIYPSYLK